MRLFAGGNKISSVFPEYCDQRTDRRLHLQTLLRYFLLQILRIVDAGFCVIVLFELMSITRNGEFTLSTVMLFGLYPQAYFPQLCITAIVVPGREIGTVGDLGAAGRYGAFRRFHRDCVSPSDLQTSGSGLAFLPYAYCPVLSDSQNTKGNLRLSGALLHVLRDTGLCHAAW